MLFPVFRNKNRLTVSAVSLFDSGFLDFQDSQMPRDRSDFTPE